MRRLKLKLLFSLANGVDFLGPKEASNYMTYKQLYWRLNDYRRVSVRGAINGLIVSGFVDRIVRGRFSFFRLTKNGRMQLAAMIPIALQGEKQWDLTWRVAIVGRGMMKLAQQRKLRNQFNNLGFAKLEKGIYVTPFSVGKEVKKRLIDMGLLSFVRLMETKRFLVGDDQSFASEVWSLDTIYNKYNLLIRRGERVLYRARRLKRLTNQVKIEYRQLLFSWFEAVFLDPGLPKRLLPSDWPRLEAQKLMDKLGKSVVELESDQKKLE